MPAMRDAVTGFGAGVRKPPKNEPRMGETCVVLRLCQSDLRRVEVGGQRFGGDRGGGDFLDRLVLGIGRATCIGSRQQCTSLRNIVSKLNSYAAIRTITANVWRHSPMASAILWPCRPGGRRT